MIIDIHTHIFPDKIASKALKKLSEVSGCAPFTDGTLNGLLKSMEESDVNISCILPVATNESQVENINNFAAKLNEEYSDKARKIISFAGIHPDFTNYKKELRRVKSMGFRGIKIHPVYQDTNIDDIRYLRIFDCAAELDIVVLTHAGFDIGFPKVSKCSPKMIRNVIKEVGNFKFILAHLGGWEEWEEVLTELVDADVYLDTAFSIGKKSLAKNSSERISLMEDDLALKIIRAFSAGKILFGSDSPWTSQKESIESIKNLHLNSDEEHKILGGNAAKLLGL